MTNYSAEVEGAVVSAEVVTGIVTFSVVAVWSEEPFWQPAKEASMPAASIAAINLDNFFIKQISNKVIYFILIWNRENVNIAKNRIFTVFLQN